MFSAGTNSGCNLNVNTSLNKTDLTSAVLCFEIELSLNVSISFHRELKIWPCLLLVFLGLLLNLSSDPAFAPHP